MAGQFNERYYVCWNKSNNQIMFGSNMSFYKEQAKIELEGTAYSVVTPWFIQMWIFAFMCDNVFTKIIIVKTKNNLIIWQIINVNNQR